MTTRPEVINAALPGATGTIPWKSLLFDPRRSVLHLGTFVVVGTILLVAGGVDIASGSAAFWALALWGSVAVLDPGFVIGRRAAVGSQQHHPPVPPGGGVVTTGSISSIVRLDYDRGTAEKRYEPTRFVRALYRLSFQAPFPYADNVHALEAARQRRTIAGLLTKFWFGENMVSRALDVRRERDGGYTLVTELVRGTEPRDARRAKTMLRQLTARFIDAGLPSWQVGHYNPRAIGNLIERDDGAYRIIDLESNLVTPILPPGALIRSIRLGQYPSFDDIDVSRLRAYLAAHRDELAERLGEEESAELSAAADAYAEAADSWYAGERRLPSRVLRFLFRLVDVPSWMRGLRGLTRGSQQVADGFIRSGIGEWVDDGHLSEAEADRLQRALATPEVAAVTANLGAHMAMSIPLRFPFGSLARFGWTLVARAKAEWAALRRSAGEGAARTARQIHTIPVALMGLVPGFGAGAYLLAKPLRANRALALIVFDRLMRRVPKRLYWRLHLSALTTWFARPVQQAARRPRLSSVIPGIRERLAAMNGQWRLVAVVAAVNATTLVAATVLHYLYGTSFAFSELGLMNSMDAAQLLAAGVLGLLAFRLFWRAAADRARTAEAAGIFLWGVTGLGLIGFAFDDFLGLHERAGDWISDHVGVMPLLTNNVDDFITLGYGVVGLAVLTVFRHELFALRASSVLLAAGVVAAALMLGTDAYGHGFVKALEFPTQVAAVGLLLLAHLTRYREVQRALPRLAATPAVSSPPFELAALPVAGDE